MLKFKNYFIPIKSKDTNFFHTYYTFDFCRHIQHLLTFLNFEFNPLNI